MLGRFGIDPPGQPAPAWTTREVARLPRVAARSRPELWPQWCAHHGVHEADCRPTLEFDNTVLAIQATSLALGVMVLPVLFIDSLLGSGLLVPLEPTRVRTGTYSYATRAWRDSHRHRLGRE